MAFGDYREGAGMYEDYLAPDQGNAGALVTAGLMAAFMYTPLGKKAFSGAFKSGRSAWRGMFRGGKALGRLAANKELGTRTFETAVRAIGGTGRALKYAGKPFMWASNNKAATYGLAFGGAAIFGGMSGMKARAPYGETPTESIHFDPNTRGGLSPSHNGATGDLTLALHGRR
ncbi:MAG: hypothetical protein DRQ88_12750 [Epsilonproteobacteria bacterium]|nr:MAG: hypothetical protein DRQ88_12750 [Campylobacterota bacterium]